MKNALNEILLTSNNKVLLVKNLKDWLSKYYDNYVQLLEYCECGSKYDDLPCVCKRDNSNEEFMELYVSLKEIFEYSKFEEYARIEINNFKKLCNSDAKIKDWLIKSEEIAIQKLCLFLIDYLDYDIEEKNIFHLLAYNKNGVEIFVDSCDFLNLINFKQLYDEMFYIKRKYPEALQKIEFEMKQAF
ncbi:hypothetical protein [Chryseobacterium sp.]|uniref:hypothetical protein n=1 Tax=Chryseobacterium sp. TaxID=1871047 RepID=UPI002FCB2F21